ncbi:MAG: Spy/CpxP family protein refolding chaperone [Mariprofundaceae bacterium]|nr:Spy/CpxP family protein refolding chaperone [Mariprofundaceae bacterium]
MKKVWTTVAVGCMLLGGTSLALASGGPGHHGGKCGDQMATALNLSDAQQQQMKQLRRDGRPEMMRLHDAMEDNRDAMHKLDPSAKDYQQQANRLTSEKGKLVEQIGKHRAAQHAAKFAILTPEQQAKASKWRKDHPKKKGECRKGGRHGPPMGMPKE